MSIFLEFFTPKKEEEIGEDKKGKEKDKKRREEKRREEKRKKERERGKVKIKIRRNKSS